MDDALKTKMAYHPILLGIIALIAGTMLVMADNGTRDEIARRIAEDLRRSLTQVVPDSEHDNNLLEDRIVLHEPLEFSDHEEGITIYRARLNGEVKAVALQVIGMGYSGAIRIMMSIRSDGSVMGVRVIQHAETPGLGDKIEIERDNWIEGFNGKSLASHEPHLWAVKKDGGSFDQFTGATITPRAVVRAVHQGLSYFKQHRDVILNTPTASDASAAEPDASSQGARNEVWHLQMNSSQRRVTGFGEQQREVEHG